MKKFDFNLPINLEKAETDDYIEIAGIASTPDKDLQNEIIAQEGLDISYLLAKKGYLNDNHGTKYAVKDHARMGIIDEAKITKDGLFIKGKIWKKHPAAISYINELKYGDSKAVQFSVEGAVVERDPFNSKKVIKARILGVALTRDPVNSNTYASLVKSFAGEAEESLFQVKEEAPVYTAEQVSALLKALGISQAYGSTAPANLSGGSAMQKENLDSNVKDVASSAFKPKSDEEKEQTKLLNEEKKKREREAKAGVNTKAKKLIKSMTCEEYEATIEKSLDLLQEKYPEKTRDELLESFSEVLEKRFFDEN